MKMIPYGKQCISQDDIDAVVNVLNSDFLTQGPKVPEFEKQIKESVQSKYAFAVNSATSALHIACLALDVSSDDIVWTTPISFVASANCALYCGAEVDFVDIDPETYNLSVVELEKKLRLTREQGKKLPKVVIPVHLCGQSCEMEKIYSLSKEFGFSIIEDASHAIGGKYKDIPIGSCKYSDVTVFSFHPVKIITTAEGGVATTNSPKVAQKLELLRSHGVTKDRSLMTDSPDGSWYYQQLLLGYNYRMTELQAALGTSQIERLKEFVEERNRLASIYDSELANLPITLPKQIPESYSARHLYVIRLKLKEISKTHKEVFDSLRNSNIGVNLHYIPIHSQPYYQGLGFETGDFPESERYYSEAISIPLFHRMSESQQTHVINEVRNIVTS